MKTGSKRNSFSETREIWRIKKAFEQEEFQVYFQPVYTADQKIQCMEALARWIKNDGSMVSPDRFIPVMEKSDMIRRLDFVILKKVLRFLRERVNDHKRVVPVSVNLSRCHMSNGDTVEKICETVDSYEVDHKLIRFEITETAIEHSMSAVRQFIHGLQQKGFAVLLDDFGSGYSTLKLLSEIRFDFIKVDKEFAMQLEHSESCLVMMKHIVKMVKEMKIPVVVEGVETDTVLETLSKMKCDYFQGFLFCRPLPEERTADLLNAV